VAEWLKAPDSKSGVGASLPWVRIPPLPPCLLFLTCNQPIGSRSTSSRQQHLSQILYADDSNGRFPFKDNISPEYRRIPITGTRSIVNRLRGTCLKETRIFICPITRKPLWAVQVTPYKPVGQANGSLIVRPKARILRCDFCVDFCNMYDDTRPARSHHVSHQQCLQVYYRVTEGVSDRALLENAACTYAHQRRFLECWLRSHW
jgi:uncharacterized protein YbaR (Trm112 family)